MPYELAYSEQAQQDLARLLPHLLDEAERGLLRLAANPTGLSRASTFPYPPNCQLYQFQIAAVDGGRHVLTVLFRYRSDESTLQVIGIGHYPLAPPDYNPDFPI